MRKMPMVFVGHGSPMNALEDNVYTRMWKEMANAMPKPKAIVAISAHWFTDGTKIMNEPHPKTVYDMYGFPKELYEITYDAPGNPDLAEQVMMRLDQQASFDNTWGIDHGTWSVLVHMYPKKDIPLFQISIDANASPEEHYRIGQKLKALREQEVLLFASGNIVHNLRHVDWNKGDVGFGWADKFDAYIKENILSRNHENVINYQAFGEASKMSVPTPDHFNPILYLLGASDESDAITVYNDSRVMGSLSMTSYLFSQNIPDTEEK